MPRIVRSAVGALVVCAALAAAPAAAYQEERDLVQVHGFYQAELRGIADGLEPGADWYASQFAHSLDLEIELDLAPDGFGPFDFVGGFVRVGVRFECIWKSGCGVFNSRKIFGNRATHAPADVFTDAKSARFAGALPIQRPEFVNGGGTRLVSFFDIPPLDTVKELGAPNFEPTFAPLGDPLAAPKGIQGTIQDTIFPLGPWNPDTRIRPLGSLRSQPNLTSPLPLRPDLNRPVRSFRDAGGLYSPSWPLQQRVGDFDDFDQNFSERDLRWNHGAGQDELELKEAYLDLELFDGRLFLRLGKQTIVWGKTELFRNQDQFNPQDLALSSLPSLEQSRIALWAVRGIWSFYNVGPLEDVRLEIAANVDDFEPTDLGRCGEPYTIFLVCAKSAGLFGHGITGFGIAGEMRPPDPWKDLDGLEIGARLEFRWDRFSFALTDFYGYSDFPSANQFHVYERRVDPRTGRPLDVLGRPLDPDDPEQARRFHPGNRQLFDVFCSASVGLAASVLDELANECAVAITNNQTPLAVAEEAGLAGVTVAEALSPIFAGNRGGATVLDALVTGEFDLSILATGPNPLVPLNRDPNDGAPLADFEAVCVLMGAILGSPACLSDVLTDQQEALLGCGPFYGTSCDLQGIDLMNAEASVLFQAFPTFEEGGPVATRYEDGRLWVLPGARGPGQQGWDPRIDGCVAPGDDPLCAGARALVDPVTGEPFENELAALSFNFMRLLAGINNALPTAEPCEAEAPETCEIVQLLVGVAGVQHPDVRAGGNGRLGRRDFLWLGGGQIQLQYEKRNILGFSMDFAEDRTKTNWGVELTWVEDDAFAVSTERNLLRKVDTWNLTVSVDRPTFVNFLNANRTFLLNAQLFTRFVPEYERRGTFQGNGPLSFLGTFTIITGYFQDRLLPAVTFVHDFSSASGAGIGSLTYRFTENFSASFTIAVFYGGPERQALPIHQTVLRNNFGTNRSTRSRTAFNGLSALAERDELGLVLRYTF